MQDKDFFDKWSSEYSFYEVYPDDEYERILKEVGILREKRNTNLILDVGSGSGAFSWRLASNGFKVIGLDLSYELLKAGCKYKGEKVDFINADALRLPLKNTSIDYIFCGASLHHFPIQLDECAKEFFRVLRWGGSVYV